jgi:hypothetical protein
VDSASEASTSTRFSWAVRAARLCGFISEDVFLEVTRVIPAEVTLRRVFPRERKLIARKEIAATDRKN